MSNRKLSDTGEATIRRHFALYGDDPDARARAIARVHDIQRRNGWAEIDPPTHCTDALHTEHTPEAAQAAIEAINNWERKPPIHAPGEVARMTDSAYAALVKVHGEATAQRMRDEINAWADARNTAHREGKRGTFFKTWTPEQIERSRKNDAERARRYRERKKAAKQALTNG